MTDALKEKVGISLELDCQLSQSRTFNVRRVANALRSSLSIHPPIAAVPQGATWTLLNPSPGFSKRSGHGVVSTGSQILVIAGWHDNKCLHDLWSSSDGSTWNLRSNDTWQVSRPRRKLY